MRRFVLALSVLGALVFGAALVASFASPALLESVGKDLIRMEVQRRVSEKLDALDNSRLVNLAQILSGKNEAELAALKRQLAEGLPARVASTIAQMRQLDCECRQAIERRMTGLMEGRIGSLAQLNDRLALLIRTRYIETTEALLREFRIFTASNALVFALLGAVTWWRPRARLQALVPAAVLLGAVCIVSGLYLFGQNWLHTILFADYLGLGYLLYLLLATVLLADLAFNRARLCSELVNGASALLGLPAHAVPC